MPILGVDCGGTHLRVGLVDSSGEVLAYKKEKSPLKENPDQFAEIVKATSEILLQEQNLHFKDIQAIGIGVPGPIDFEKGSILKSANLFNENPIQFLRNFEQLFGRKIYFDKDTNNCLRGEIWKSDLKDETIVMLTLGTGVGVAAFVNGELMKGESGIEIGHIFLQIPDLIDHAEDKDAPRCGLGHAGCFEALIKSSSAPKDIGYYLGYGLANIVDIFNPDRIIVGGGMMHHGDFLPQAIEIMKEKAVFPAGEDVIVEYSKLGDLSGVVGSAKLAMESNGI